MSIHSYEAWQWLVRMGIATFTTLLGRFLVLANSNPVMMLGEREIFHDGADIVTHLGGKLDTPLSIEVKARSSKHSHAVRMDQLSAYLDNLAIDFFPSYMLYFLVGYRNSNVTYLTKKGEVRSGTAMGRIHHTRGEIYSYLARAIDFLYIIDPRVLSACCDLGLARLQGQGDVFYTPRDISPSELSIFALFPRTLLRGLVRGSRAGVTHSAESRSSVLSRLADTSSESWVTAHGDMSALLSFVVLPLDYVGGDDIFGIRDEPIEGKYDMSIPDVGYFGTRELYELLCSRFSQRGINHSLAIT